MRLPMITVLLGRYLWNFRNGTWEIRWVAKIVPAQGEVISPRPALPFLRVEVS